MEERYIASVDLGTSKIGLAVARVLGDDTQVLYYRETPSDGVRHGSIFNPVKASEKIKEAVKLAEDELGIKILQVITGLPRYYMVQEAGTATLPITDPDGGITQDEVDLLKSNAIETYPIEDRNKELIYGAIAQSFSAEDAINYNESDIVGVPSGSLEGNFKIFLGSRKSVSNIDATINKVGIGAADKCFLPELTARAVLSSEERSNGVALVEMGAGVTSVTIYQKGILRFYSSIPFGGRNITWDIKNECGFTERLAENIKLAYGACIPEKLQSMGEKIIQVNNDEDGTCEQLTVKYLSDIITCRAREIVEAILFEIQRSGYAERLRNGVVLTGGCAELVNCGNLIKEMSGYNVRIGYPRSKKVGTASCPDICGIGAAASFGMILYGMEKGNLNCSESIREVSRPSDAGMEGTAVEGTLFGDKPEEPEELPGKKNKKIKITWGDKIKEKFGEKFGRMYDEMK